MVVRTPSTLVIDAGGTSIKSIAFDAAGRTIGPLDRMATAYPLGPHDLVANVAALATAQPVTDRVSMGFPGMVRDGRVLTAPEYVTVAGLGTGVSSGLVDAWTDFALVDALGSALAQPVRVANDADLRGIGVATGRGLELIATLGTGFGTAVVRDGVLAPHLELAHAELGDGQTYNQQLGDRARREIGDDEWTTRVDRALTALHRLIMYDRVWLLGGNTPSLTRDLGPSVTVVEDPAAGLVGGVRLWC
jgi:polyphosphate glucokinase